nr:unnamed protein product [Callosobruchus analis]
MFVDWKPSDWAHHTGLDSHFQLNLGVLTVKEAGLFFIYSQIYYLDEHDIIGYKVFRNNDVILQCTITVHTTERRMKGNTCYTAGMEYLHEGDTISIENVYDGRYSLFEPGKSFFGIIKLVSSRILCQGTTGVKASPY